MKRSARNGSAPLAPILVRDACGSSRKGVSHLLRRPDALAVKPDIDDLGVDACFRAGMGRENSVAPPFNFWLCSIYLNAACFRTQSRLNGQGLVKESPGC